MLQFPYGISDFNLIRKEHYLYLDRTHLIPELEQAGRQLVFLRPRRFGKSLLISMLAHYYDVNKAAEFETLFGGLAVGADPTPEHSRYLVLRWDFSEVSAQGDIEQIKQNLFDYLNASVEAFCLTYANILEEPPKINPDNALISVRNLMGAAQQAGHQVYLLIDEYDNFANEILMHDQSDEQRYRDLLEGEGIVKSLFKLIKAQASEGKIGRVFITGVSPLVLADVTSGYNVATSIFLEPEFHTLCGITTPELEELIETVITGCGQGNEQKIIILGLMRDFYNGYRFCSDMNQSRLYNPTLCFYFLRHYQKRGQAPTQMLDGNMATDAGRIRYIAQLPEGDKVIHRIMNEEQPLTLPYLEAQFGVVHVKKLQEDSRYMASLMYFLGILTVQAVGELGELQLGIPNLTIRALYVQQLLEQALPHPNDQQSVEELAKAFYQNADLDPLADYMEQKYFAVFSNRDYRWSNELTVKTAFLTLLFNDFWYVMDSEAVVQRRYTDLIMIIRPNMRRYAPLRDLVLEFKYVELKTLGLSAEQVRARPRDELAQLPVIKAALDEAQAQLLDYRQILAGKTGEPERLCALAVVALGFERVVWRAVMH